MPLGVTNGAACFQCTVDEILKVVGINDTFDYIGNVTVCGCTKADHDGNLDQLLKAVTVSDKTKFLDCLISQGEVGPDP